jgi:hypothetical protein
VLKKSTAEVLRRKDGSCNAWTKRELRPPPPATQKNFGCETG